MNAPDWMLRRQAHRANAVLMERLADMGGLLSWHEKRYRQHVAQGCASGSPEKLAMVLACPLLDVAIDGAAAVLPQGKPS